MTSFLSRFLAMGRPLYTHRLYKSCFYDDRVRTYLSMPDGHAVVASIFEVLSASPWLLAIKKQYWQVTPLSARSHILRCSDRKGRVLYYRIIEGRGLQAGKQHFIFCRSVLTISAVKAPFKVKRLVSKMVVRRFINSIYPIDNARKNLIT